jgi:lysozyme
MARLTTSETGLAMIKRFEGFQAEALALPDGQWLIGHGHLRMSAIDGVITSDEAHADLLLDLVPYEEMINFRVTVPVSQAQFDGLVSFAFSIGLAAFERSDVLRRLNAGDVIAAAAALDAWRKTRLFGEAVVLDALVRRRSVERSLLLETEGAVVAPSALVRPQLDHAASILGAPSKVALMGTLEEAIVASAEEPAAEPVAATADPVAARIARILAAEPATASALAAVGTDGSFQGTPDDDGDDLPAVEDVAPQLAVAPSSAPDAAAATVAAPKAAAAKAGFGLSLDSVALLGLLVFGLGLLGLAGLAISYGSENGGGYLTAAVLGAPGALAVAMAAYYLVRGNDHPAA